RRSASRVALVPDLIAFETRRLRLMAWQERHIAPLAAMNADPEAMRYFPATLAQEQTRAGVEMWRSQFAWLGAFGGTVTPPSETRHHSQWASGSWNPTTAYPGSFTHFLRAPAARRIDGRREGNDGCLCDLRRRDPRREPAPAV